MKKPKRLIKIIGIVLTSVAGCIVLFVVAFEIFMSHMTSQELIGNYPSPDGEHTAYIYLYDGGATTPFSILCDVKGERIFGKRRIYVKDHIDTATVEWIDERTVRINGVTLDIFDDKYTDPGY